MMRRSLGAMTLVVVAALAGAGAAQASSANLALSLQGAGSKTGEKQTLTASVTNTGSDAFTPKACVSWSATYMTLAGSNCYTWPTALGPGSGGTTSWDFTSKKPGSGAFTVKLYKSGSTTVLTSGSQTYTITAKGPEIKLVLKSDSLTLSKGYPGEIKAEAQNTGDKLISSHKICLEKPSLAQVNLPSLSSLINGLSYYCYTTYTAIPAATGTTAGKNGVIKTFKLTGLAPGQGTLNLKAISTSTMQPTENSVQIPYQVNAPQFVMTAGAIKRKGLTRSRSLTFTNQGTAAPAEELRACVTINSGKILSMTPEVFTAKREACAFVGYPGPGESAKVDIKAKGKNIKAKVELLPSGYTPEMCKAEGCTGYYSGTTSLR